MKKRDRFDDDALEFVFDSMEFHAALEDQNNLKLAEALAMLMRCRYGTDAEVEAAKKRAPKRKTKAVDPESPPSSREVRVFLSADGSTLAFPGGAFATVRACRHCGALITGGPTACVHCVSRLEGK